LHYGKWGLTLVDTATNRAVRVAPKGEVMAANKQSEFITKYRAKGIPASQVPDEVAEPLVEKVMSAPDEEILNISEVFDYEFTPKPHSFDGFICDLCGEMVVERYGRPLGDKKVCQPCYEKAHQEH
ncbi:MAG: tRNA CCA-pyrophosphorylase, partial [Candidatus Zixiibacteriota bacterium]